LLFHVNAVKETVDALITQHLAIKNIDGGIDGSRPTQLFKQGRRGVNGL